MNTQSITNYPASISNNPQIKALDEALGLFLEALKEFSKTQNLTETQTLALESLIKDAYLEKKMEYYLQSRLGGFSSRLNFLLNEDLIYKPKGDVHSPTDFLYLNHINQLVTNE
ncbi:MAG: hypothetical protein ACK41O_04500 [Runella zeae]